MNSSVQSAPPVDDIDIRVKANDESQGDGAEMVLDQLADELAALLRASSGHVQRYAVLEIMADDVQRRVTVLSNRLAYSAPATSMYQATLHPLADARVQLADVCRARQELATQERNRRRRINDIGREWAVWAAKLKDAA